MISQCVKLLQNYLKDKNVDRRETNETKRVQSKRRNCL